MKRILKFIGCLALGCVGLTTLATTTQVANQDALNAAVAAAKVGDVIEITAADTYKMPNVPQNITIQAKAGVDVTFNCVGSGSICSVPNGAKLEGISFVFGNNSYHGWQHAGLMEFTNCSFDGLFFSYGDLRFEKCAFVQTTGEYLMWLYANKTDFVDCTFTAQGKFFNIYNEGNATHGPWPISFDGCTFSSSKSNKAALNVKATCGTTPMLYDVTVNNCKIDPNGDKFPTASVSDTLIVFNGLIQLDDIKANVPNEITITQDGRVIYKDNAPIPEPITVTVVKNEEKGVTQDVVTEIAGNKEVGKLEETGLKEALPAEELAKGEPVIKVQLQEVAANTLKFDVSPYVGTEKVESELNGKPVAVRLPLVAAKFDGEYAKIIHGSDPDQFVLVKKGTTGAYVDLTLTHFSEIDVVLAQAEELVHAVDASAVQIQPGLWGANGVTDMGHAEIVYSVGATGLKAFRDWVNEGNSGEGKTFQLVADVDLGNENWTPIATSKGLSFKDTFDGAGHTISGLKIEGDPSVDMDIGLFGYITTGATLKNFTVDGSVVVKFIKDTGDGNGGGAGVVGYMTGGTVDSVTNRASVSSVGTYGRLGGICGISNRDGDNVIKNCVNFGDITQDTSIAVAGGHSGGIIGQCQAKISLENCVNYGTVSGGRVASGAGNGTESIGGIVGGQKSTVTTDWPVSIIRCVNYGTVQGLPYAQNIGGVFGKEGSVNGSHTDVLEFIIADSANYGEVTGEKASGGGKGDFFASLQTRGGYKATGTITVRHGKLFCGNSCSITSFGVVAMCPDVAKDINGNDIDVDTYYTSIADAVAAAKEGDTVTLVAASSENFTLKVGVTFDATKAAYSGTISAPEGYFVKEVSTKVYECKPAVAQIGTTIYSSFKEAYDATVDGDTITILADFALKEAFKLGVVDRNNLIIDLNGKTMTLNSVVSTQYKNLTFKNGAIDIGVPAGGQAGEHAWDKLFYVESCELKFLNVTLTYTNGVSTVGIQTGGTAKLAFKDSMLNFANCDKPVYLGTPGDCVFDHTVISADKATTYVVHGDYNCGPVIFKGGSSVTMKDCGGLNSNSTFEMSDTTVNATGLKNPLFRNSSVTLVSNAKIFVDGAANMFGYNAYELVVNAGCTFDVRNCGYTGAIFNRGGSVFKSGSTVVISNCCVTENTTHACYGKDNAIRAYGDLMIEDGADVRLYGTIDAFSGPGTITIADGRYTKLVQSVATEKFDLKGGIYTVEPADAFVNEAYEKVANEDPDTKDAYPTRVQAKPSVASYETEDGVVNTYLLEKAVELVKVGGTITLLAPNAESFTTTRTEPFTLVTSEGKAFTGKITMPNGYALKDNGDGTYSYYKMPIATITREAVTTEYDSLPAACAAAQNGDTIVLSPMIIDATSETAIAGLNNKRVVVKGAGMDVTTLNWGTGKKTGPSGADFGTAEIMFQDLAFTVDHANGEPYKEHFKPMASLAFKGVKVNGMLVVDNDATFDGCTFTGPRYNSKTAADDEYLLWLYKGKLMVMNCTFPGTGTHAPIKLYSEPTMPDNVCALDISNCTFAVVGDQNGAIVSSCKHTTPKYTKDQVYDVQIDTDSITIPDGAYYVGLESGQWAAKGVTIINGTKDKNGKYVSGVVFSSVGEDTDINRIVNLFIGPDSACLPYVGPETNLADFRWYIGDKQLTPKTDDVEVGGLPENPPQEMKDQVAADTNNVIKTLSGDDITKFAETDVAGSSFNDDGTPKDVVKQALVDAATEDTVRDAIAAQLGESNSNERIEIKLDKFEFAVQDQSATLSVVEYDVKPWIKVTTIVDNVEKVTEAVIPNSALAGHPLTFRLAVNSNFVNYAKVVHKDDGGNELETYLTKVFTGATGKYVQLKSDHFSNFFLSADVTEPKCKVGDQFYNSVQEAIAENADVPDAVFTLTAPCSETGLALKWGQVIDVNGQEFSGAINPVDPEGNPASETYEQAKTPDGLVFSAPKKIEVPTSDEAGAPKIKVRIAGMTADQLKAIQPTSKRPLWADIVMGTSEKLIPFVPRSPIGSGTVTIKTTLLDSTFERTAVTVRDGVSVKYQLKKRVGNGDFLEYGEVKDIPVFTVDAAELETRTSWKIETIFDEEY